MVQAAGYTLRARKSASTFWQAFDDMVCMPTDWADWDLELLGSGYARVDCECGAHRAEAFTVHDRWIMIVLVPRSLAFAQNHIDHAVDRLKSLLPDSHLQRWPSGSTGGQAGGGGPGPAELGIPISWKRKRESN